MQIVLLKQNGKQIQIQKYMKIIVYTMKPDLKKKKMQKNLFYLCKEKKLK